MFDWTEIDCNRKVGWRGCSRLPWFAIMVGFGHWNDIRIDQIATTLGGLTCKRYRISALLLRVGGFCGFGFFKSESNKAQVDVLRHVQ